MSAPTFEQVISTLDSMYPREFAEPWDAVGPVCGDLAAPIRRVLFCVDPHPAVVAEAIERDVDLIVAHHPLMLTPVHSVATDHPTGAVVHALIRHDIALFTAHTNADAAVDGVSDALAAAVGIAECVPLQPFAGASPDIAAPDGIGLGRVGDLAEPERLSVFAQRVRDALPATAHGVRVAGAADQLVSRVAVCGGSGDSFLAAAVAAGADVYLTADLKHHRLLDHQLAAGCAVIDVAHWASEWPWLPRAAKRLTDLLGKQGATVEALVSTLVTDPWAFHLGGSPQHLLTTPRRSA